MSIPSINQQGNKRVLTVDDQPFFMLAGEVHNSDSSDPEYMEHIWDIAEGLGMNSVLLPVTWELVEPVEGEFHFEIVDRLIDQAAERGMRIGFLWFGSWKNAECMYAPTWVKIDTDRFARAEIVKGEKKAGRQVMPNLPIKMPYYSISYLSEAAMKADANAFAKLMAHIRDYDTNHVVITVQVENETGLLGNSREMSDAADAAFAQTVPEEFASYMRAQAEKMPEDVRAAIAAGAEQGSWAEVFTSVADEVFSAYYVASFVEYVAAAGKKEYPLPMAANCWLDKGGKPGAYPSGGPVARMHAVWRYCAPDIDALCPDIYVPNFNQICDDYSATENNPLYIPEAATHAYAAGRMIYTIGHYHAMCYSPFGFDDIGKPFTAQQGFLFGMDVTDPALKTPQNFEEYGALGHELREAMPLIAAVYGTADLQAVSAEHETEIKKAANLPADMNPFAKMMAEAKLASRMVFGDVCITPGFGGMMQPRNDGAILAFRGSDGAIYLIGEQCSLQFASADPAKPNFDILEFNEGHFKNGEFVPGRRLNGDEAANISVDAPKALRLTYHVY